MAFLGVPKNHKLRFYSSFSLRRKCRPKTLGRYFAKVWSLFVCACSLKPAIAAKLSFTGTSYLFFFCLSFFLGKEWTLFFFFRGGDFEELLIVHDNQSVRLLRRRLLSEISFPVRAKMPPERKK